MDKWRRLSGASGEDSVGLASPLFLCAEGSLMAEMIGGSRHTCETREWGAVGDWKWGAQAREDEWRQRDIKLRVLIKTLVN